MLRSKKICRNQCGITSIPEDPIVSILTDEWSRSYLCDRQEHESNCVYSVHCFAAEGSVASWLDEARGDVESLLDLAKNEARHDEARESLLSIQKAAVERWQAVDTLLCLAADFVKGRQVCC